MEKLKELSSKIQALSSKVEIVVKLTSWLADSLRKFPSL
jgi:hypothetical protein